MSQRGGICFNRLWASAAAASRKLHCIRSLVDDRSESSTMFIDPLPPFNCPAALFGQNLTTTIAGGRPRIRAGCMQEQSIRQQARGTRQVLPRQPGGATSASMPPPRYGYSDWTGGQAAAEESQLPPTAPTASSLTRPLPGWSSDVFSGTCCPDPDWADLG